jgi:hypothetical protein
MLKSVGVGLKCDVGSGREIGSGRCVGLILGIWFGVGMMKKFSSRQLEMYRAEVPEFCVVLSLFFLLLDFYGTK